ncbi:MAG: SMC-Scp complex subunit ScpB [Candidatus Moraniibacteriota bacterium]|jgi:segregation and condensation protein B
MENKNINIVAVLESLLFMYGREITFDKIGELLELTDEDVKSAVDNLKEEYESRKSCGMRILSHDDEIQMVTNPESSKIIEQITKKELEGPLTPVAMEVLAIIAYRGPINKIDVEAIRGVNCAFTIRNLKRRGLIEQSKNEENKRLQKYQTTIDFLRVLGVESVNELPEFEELSNDKRIDAIIYSDNENQGQL